MLTAFPKRSLVNFGFQPRAVARRKVLGDRYRLVAAGDPARLNVGRHGHLTFEDGRVERPLHLRHRPLNAGRPIQQTDC